MDERYWNWDDDRRPSLNRYRIWGDVPKWFDMTQPPPVEPRLRTVEMEVRSQHGFAISMRMGEMFITSSGPNDLDGIVTMRINVEASYDVGNYR